jgi:hypothetical protein
MNLSSTYILVPPPTISMGCPNRTVLELQRLIQYIMFAAKSLFWSDSPFQSLCLVYYTAPENKEEKKNNNNCLTKLAMTSICADIHPACVSESPGIPKQGSCCELICFVSWIELSHHVAYIHSRRADGGTHNENNGEMLDIITTSLDADFTLSNAVRDAKEYNSVEFL